MIGYIFPQSGRIGEVWKRFIGITQNRAFSESVMLHKRVWRGGSRFGGLRGTAVWFQKFLLENYSFQIDNEDSVYLCESRHSQYCSSGFKDFLFKNIKLQKRSV